MLYLCTLQINNEKGQALLEFLTPEDASAALSFDCSSISGSTLKLRRPKDFVDVAVRIITFCSYFCYCLTVFICLFDFISVT